MLVYACGTKLTAVRPKNVGHKDANEPHGHVVVHKRGHGDAKPFSPHRRASAEKRAEVLGQGHDEVRAGPVELEHRAERLDLGNGRDGRNANALGILVHKLRDHVGNGGVHRLQLDGINADECERAAPNERKRNRERQSAARCGPCRPDANDAGNENAWHRGDLRHESYDRRRHQRASERRKRLQWVARSQGDGRTVPNGKAPEHGDVPGDNTAERADDEPGNERRTAAWCLCAIPRGNNPALFGRGTLEVRRIPERKRPGLLVCTLLHRHDLVVLSRTPHLAAVAAAAAGDHGDGVGQERHNAGALDGNRDIVLVLRAGASDATRL